MANDGNLKPIDGADMARRLGRAGGVKSGKRRAEARTMREALKAILATEIPKGSALYPKMRAQMEAMGIGGRPQVMLMPLLGLVNKAAHGSPEAFSVIRDTIGEKPKDVIESVAAPPPVVLGLFDPARVEGERARQDAEADRARAPADGKALERTPERAETQTTQTTQTTQARS